jgi:hypothetical protein
MGREERTITMKIDFSKLIPIDSMVGEDKDETAQFGILYSNAKMFIESFRWAGKVKTVLFGLGVADIVGVFLFEIIPNSEDVDPFIWVAVGDIPPAYLVTDETPNPACALDAYIGEMNKWVDAVFAGKPISNLIPVNGAPTIENARQLKKKLEFLDKEILSYYSDDLK